MISEERAGGEGSEADHVGMNSAENPVGIPPEEVRVGMSSAEDPSEGMSPRRRASGYGRAACCQRGGPGVVGAML